MDLISFIRVAVPALALALGPSLACAQGTQIALGNLAHDPDQPVEVTAETLNVDQADGTAVFSGDVVAAQGDMRLSAARILIVYGEEGSGAGRIARMEAEGNVVLVVGDEAAEAQRGIYTIESGTVVLTGNVLLTQGRSAIAGERLVVDLNRGTGTMEGRVRTVLQPEGEEQ